MKHNTETLQLERNEGKRHESQEVHGRLENDTEPIFPKWWSMLEEQNMLLGSGWGPQETGMAALDS